MKLKKLISLILCIVMIAALTGCEEDVPEKTDTEKNDRETTVAEVIHTDTPDTETPDTETPDTETPDTETPDTETTDTEEPNFDAEIEVYDAFCEKIEVSGYDGVDFCCYHIPAVKVDGKECTTVNQQIYDQLYASTKEAADETRKNGTVSFISNTHYTYYRHDQLLSIVTWSESLIVDYFESSIFTINPYKDEIVGTAEVLKAYGYTESQFLETLSAQLAAYYQYNWRSDYESALQKTLDYVSLDNVKLFVGPEGNLCVGLRIYNLFGPECSNILLDLTTGEGIVHYKCPSCS